MGIRPEYWWLWSNFAAYIVNADKIMNRNGKAKRKALDAVRIKIRLQKETTTDLFIGNLWLVSESFVNAWPLWII
ncbi:hypothetical protein TSMEX_000427 [Taenia solium]|eukprot:TsM_000426300 transcript=TsM_000426300 gene=TsM_000426300